MNDFTDLSELKNLDDWLIENEDKNIIYKKKGDIYEN